MKNITPYFTFNGNCREVMTFYQQCLGGELDIKYFSEAPMEDFPEEVKSKVMHAVLINGAVEIMASDGMPNEKVVIGSSLALSINCASAEELDRYFNALSDGAEIKMPVQDTFWGARFGMLVDKFGTHWMFNFDYPKDGK